MSHQIIITFDLDENKVQENAEKEAGRQIAQRICKEVFGDTYMGAYSAKQNAVSFLATEMKHIMEENKEEIIDQAIKEVVGSLSRSKIVRERLQEELKNADEQGT